MKFFVAREVCWSSVVEGEVFCDMRGLLEVCLSLKLKCFNLIEGSVVWVVAVCV